MGLKVALLAKTGVRADMDFSPLRIVKEPFLRALGTAGTPIRSLVFVCIAWPKGSARKIGRTRKL